MMSQLDASYSVKSVTFDVPARSGHYVDGVEHKW